MSMTDTGTYQQMPMMKYMMYFMPLMFFFMFNDYSSGLCYYYFISMLITVIQTLLIRRSVDDEKLLRKIKENREKPVQKTGWMERISEIQRMAAEQQAMQKQNGANNRR